jgi:hypothetical protein
MNKRFARPVFFYIRPTSSIAGQQQRKSISPAAMEVHTKKNESQPPFEP